MIFSTLVLTTWDIWIRVLRHRRVRQTKWLSIRGNLFDPKQMRPLPHNVPGPDNDLNEKIDAYVQRAIGDERACIYAFGERWGPETGQKIKYFDFKPGLAFTRLWPGELGFMYIYCNFK
jgi:uncharacterized protein YukJ